MNQSPLPYWLAPGAATAALVALVVGEFGTPGPWLVIAGVLAAATVAATIFALQFTRRLDQQLAEKRDQLQLSERKANDLKQELTHHSQMEGELTRAKQAAESAVMAKGEFLATMSHEIRTPLNGIIPMLDLLASTRLGVDQQEILKTATASAQQLLRIVDDILDYSKLEADKLELETTGFNLRELLQSVITLMERPAQAKGLHLLLYIDPSVRLPVRGDPVRLRQILSNLLSNAIKFTERGSVTITVRKTGETASQHQLRLEVQDTGIGISHEKREKLFQPFSQADTSTTRIYGGTGLGLVISQRIVELMGGHIGVDSNPGSGSTFWFEVPLLKAQGDMPSHQEDLHGGRVLLITTDARLRMRLTMLLPNWGLRITAVENTHDALERLRQAHAQGEPWTFSVVLADLSSIRSTALSLARNMERHQQYGDVRLVYLRSDEITSLELPMASTIIPRNVSDSDLRATLSASGVSWSQQELHPQPLSNPQAEDIARVPRILLVEDNPVNLMVAQRLLQVLGAECETAGNGQVALEKMDIGNYDLVLMDCQMPVLDGYSATRRWREVELERNVSRRLPIVAMTANAMAGDRRKCLDAGMDDYLAKPVSRSELEQCIQRWKNAAMPLPAAVPAPTTQSVQEPPAEAVLDKAVLGELRDLLGSEVDHIISVYLEDAPRLVAQLERAAVANDPIALRVAAHSLKSSSANVGAMPLSVAARELEHAARDGTLTQPASAVAKIVGEFSKTRAALQAILASSAGQ